MITIDTVSKKYGKAEVLNIDALEIPTGQSFGLVGNNGAGKTTLFNILLDLIRPTTGAIVTNDISVNKSEAWKKFTGSFIDESFLISYLTPEEYFQFIGDLRGINKADVKEFLSQFDEFFNEEVLEKKKYLRDLSKGKQKKVGI
ncbi:MAG: ATP-binding cassette domain-containing protein, partial [Flavobacterium sp.]|nr:ATP-binding cassette domain-containing protein [Flavobacterium sp.]